MKLLYVVVSNLAAITLLIYLLYICLLLIGIIFKRFTMKKLFLRKRYSLCLFILFLIFHFVSLYIFDINSEINALATKGELIGIWNQNSSNEKIELSRDKYVYYNGTEIVDEGAWDLDDWNITLISSRNNDTPRIRVIISFDERLLIKYKYKGWDIGPGVLHDAFKRKANGEQTS